LIRFILNQKEITTELTPGYLLLDLIRYQQHLTGTKIGCREGDCGACTVLVGEIQNDELVYQSVTSCLMPIGNANGKHIVTIEGVNIEGLNFIQQSFADEAATQCGFCTPGFIVSLAGYCLNEKTSGCQAAIDSVNGNICRCTGYKSIEKAAAKVSEKMSRRKSEDAISFAVSNQILPGYFSEIKNRLLELQSRTNGQLNASGNNIKFLGGGTDLYVQQHETMIYANVDLMFDKESLNGITQKDNRCYLGASVTVADVMDSSILQKHFPNLNQFMKLVSSTQIRNMATLAGNFINASPIGDMTIFFLALDARLILNDGTNKRETALRDIYKGYKTLDKSADEFVEHFYFELPDSSTLFNFEKVSKRTHLDIASVNSAMTISIDGELITSAGISAGGVGPIPFYLKKSSAFLVGKNISEETVTALLEIVQSEITPISDARGSGSYKRLLLNQLIKAHFIQLFPKLSVENLISI
jgi:xanthine dehydrogenase small subunit